MEKLFHVRKFDRANGALAFTMVAADNAVVGSGDDDSHIFGVEYAMSAERHAYAAIITESLIDGRIPRDQFPGNGHFILLLVHR